MDSLPPKHQPFHPRQTPHRTPPILHHKLRHNRRFPRRTPLSNSSNKRTTSPGPLSPHNSPSSHPRHPNPRSTRPHRDTHRRQPLGHQPQQEDLGRRRRGVPTGEVARRWTRNQRSAQFDHIFAWTAKLYRAGFFPSGIEVFGCCAGSEIRVEDGGSGGCC